MGPKKSTRYYTHDKGKLSLLNLKYAVGSHFHFVLCCKDWQTGIVVQQRNCEPFTAGETAEVVDKGKR